MAKGERDHVQKPIFYARKGTSTAIEGISRLQLLPKTKGEEEQKGKTM